MKAIYGVTLNRNGEYRDISNTLLGAKQFATRNGYREVYKRIGSIVRKVSIKENGKWITPSTTQEYKEKPKVIEDLLSEKELVELFSRPSTKNPPCCRTMNFNG